jgi:hypothetical protein
MGQQDRKGRKAAEITLGSAGALTRRMYSLWMLFQSQMHQTHCVPCLVFPQGVTAIWGFLAGVFISVPHCVQHTGAN